MKRIIAISFFLVSLVLTFSCQKEFVPSIGLAVDYGDSLGGMVLRTSAADTCYIHIVSNADWNASLLFEGAGQNWASIGTTSGSGQAWIPFYAEENTAGEARTVKFRVSDSSAQKSCEFTIRQPASSI